MADNRGRGAFVGIDVAKLRNAVAIADAGRIGEFCGLVGTLIVDEDGIYDATSPNDRLLLGMKGTMSEMESAALSTQLLDAAPVWAVWFRAASLAA